MSKFPALTMDLEQLQSINEYQCSFENQYYSKVYCRVQTVHMMVSFISVYTISRDTVNTLRSSVALVHYFIAIFLCSLHYELLYGGQGPNNVQYLSCMNSPEAWKPFVCSGSQGLFMAWPGGRKQNQLGDLKIISVSGINFNPSFTESTLSYLWLCLRAGKRMRREV